MKRHKTHDLLNERFSNPLIYRLSMPKHIWNDISPFFHCSADILKKFVWSFTEKVAKERSTCHYTDRILFLKDLQCFFSSPEPKAPRWAISIPVTPASVVRPSVRQHFQTSSPLKPLGQLNLNFIWRLLRMGERKFVQMVPVTCPYMVKTL